MGVVESAAASEQLEPFHVLERRLWEAVSAVGRAAVVLLLVLCEARLCGLAGESLEVAGRRFRRAPPQARNLTTLFGVVRYWRSYRRHASAESGRGFHPLDVALGLTGDRISFNVLRLAARLATRVSFAEARLVLSWFLPVPVSTEVIEQTVLGLGRYVQGYLQARPAPQKDGEVLITLFDCKAAPTATEEELEKRRGKRHQHHKAASPRHRARALRNSRPRKPRRKKGDKSKNGKAATMVVMYTLKREGHQLLGPINVRRYASFAPIEHAFEFARREADKRGFTQDSGKLAQVLTDGDNHLAYYVNKHFPEAIHTIDAAHVIEKLWTAGECLYPEGSEQLKSWVRTQKEHLLGGQAAKVADHLQAALEATPKTGPGNKGRRDRLGQVLRYVSKRLPLLNYNELLWQDLEIGTGMIEGAIKNTVGKRCDHGGMRWIKERAEAVLQLRCIELDGDWDHFTGWAHTQMATAARNADRVRLQTNTPAPLPALAEAA